MGITFFAPETRYYSPALQAHVSYDVLEGWSIRMAGGLPPCHMRAADVLDLVFDPANGFRPMAQAPSPHT